MSATATVREPATGRGVTLPRVIHSEWTKLWSLRSTRWSLLAAWVSMAGLGPLVAAITMAQWNHLSPLDRFTFNPVDRGLIGYHLAQLPIAVLGVMVISGEYSTGMIRSSLMAAPKRLPVLGAKILVYSSVVTVLMLVTAVISFYSSQAIFTQHHVNATLGSPDALRTLIGCVLFLAVTGVFCTALGTIIRSTAGSISTYVGLMFVLPVISDILPSSLSHAINPYLPSVAGTGIATALPQPYTFAPWGGFALFCGYTLVLVAVAAYLLLKRDA